VGGLSLASEPSTVIEARSPTGGCSLTAAGGGVPGGQPQRINEFIEPGCCG
jgi:hypothetical protein